MRIQTDDSKMFMAVREDWIQATAKEQLGRKLNAKELRYLSAAILESYVSMTNQIDRWIKALFPKKKGWRKPK